MDKTISLLQGLMQITYKPYTTLKAQVIQAQIMDSFPDLAEYALPTSDKPLTNEQLILGARFEVFAMVYPMIVDIVFVKDDREWPDSLRRFSAWWESRPKSDWPALWEGFIENTSETIFEQLLIGFKRSREEIPLAQAELQHGAKERAERDPEFKKKETE